MRQGVGCGASSQHGVTYRASSESGEGVEVCDTLGAPVASEPLGVFVPRSLDVAFAAAP